MKCIFCEQELEPVSDDAIAQPVAGGEVRVSFHYGSQKWDHIVFRHASSNPKFDEEVVLPHPDGDIKTTMSNWSEPLPDKELEEWGDKVDTDHRTMKLAACTHILGVICDDCFEKKAHLFQGFEQEGPEERPKLRVE